MKYLIENITLLVLEKIFFTIMLGLALSIPIRWLWNMLVPDLFGLPAISCWQSLGLFVTAHLLLGNIKVEFIKGGEDGHEHRNKYLHSPYRHFDNR